MRQRHRADPGTGTGCPLDRAARRPSLNKICILFTARLAAVGRPPGAVGSGGLFPLGLVVVAALAPAPGGLNKTIDFVYRPVVPGALAAARPWPLLSAPGAALRPLLVRAGGRRRIRAPGRPQAAMVRLRAQERGTGDERNGYEWWLSSDQRAPANAYQMPSVSRYGYRGFSSVAPLPLMPEGIGYRAQSEKKDRPVKACHHHSNSVPLFDLPYFAWYSSQAIA